MNQLWNIELTESLGDILEGKSLEFIDVRQIYNNYVGFEKSVFDELLENFNKYDNYESENKILGIISPEGENLSDRPILILIGLDKNNLKFGMLLYLGEEDTIILGLWPEQFFEAVKSDENVLIGAIVAFLKAPENWKLVKMVLPSQFKKLEAEEK